MILILSFYLKKATLAAGRRMDGKAVEADQYTKALNTRAGVKQVS